MKKIISLVALSLLTIYGIADELVEDELLGIYGSEEFISIATGFKQSVEKAPAVASVIDAQQIRKMGASDLDEVLESVPGLHVAYNYQGYFPIYTFRGIYSGFNPQVLLLIDGVPQTNLFTGGKNFIWAGMPVEAINRIEIIRGPGSAIYGAEAFAGVINVITKGGPEGKESNEVGIKYGSFNTKNIFGNYQKSWDNSNLYIGAQSFFSDGHKEPIGSDLQSQLDLFTGTSASRAPGPVSLTRENLDLNLRYDIADLTIRAGYQGRRNMGNGAGIAQTLDQTARYQSDRVQLSFDYDIKELIADLDVLINGSYFDVSQEIDKDQILFPSGSTGPFLSPNGTPLFGIFPDGVIGNPEVYERHTRFNTAFHYKGFDDHDLSFGIGYYYGDLYKVREEKNYCTDVPSCQFILPGLQTSHLVDVSDTPFVFLREGDRENRYAYLQNVYSLANDWEITAGVRYDNYSDFGDTVNPRFAVVWSTTNDFTTKFLYGEAFRAPSFQETRAINNPAVLGNPDLQPESLKSYELVFDYKATYQLDFVVNTFYYEWKDIILFTPDASGGTSTAQNVGRQTGYGVEFESEWRASPEFNLKANFAWQKSTNETTDRDAANAPGKQLYLHANWEYSPDTIFNLRANWVMDREREAGDIRDNIDDYLTVDLSWRRQNIWENVEAAIVLHNLFDEDVREPTPSGIPAPAIPNDLPLAGRAVSAELRYQFK
jgi:outer membrane receptor for ferrienterochelin and colicin